MKKPPAKNPTKAGGPKGGGGVGGGGGGAGDRKKSVATGSKADLIKKKKTKDDDDETTKLGGHQDDVEDWMQPKQLVKPDDQLVLTEEELKEEFTRILTANNPHAPDNIVRFSFKEQTYKQVPTVNQLAVHFTLEGNLLHKESEEARRQLASSDALDEPDEDGGDDGDKDDDGDKEDAKPEEKPDVEDAAVSPTPKGGATGAKLTNQFNFCERASQSYNNPYRERGTMTEPPPRVNFSATANQWEIYDAYVEDLLIQQKEKEKDVKKTKKDDDKKKKNASSEVVTDDIGRVARSSKIVERMVNQNTFDAIAHDFKYFEDASDEYRDGEGTCLPLWKFNYERSKRMTVTAISWSPKYSDLFAVGHGSYDFLKQSSGMVCLYSLKNPSFPEHVYATDHGVMCLDIHPAYCHLIVVGFYDGSIGVFNLEEKTGKPVYMSNARNGKHTDPVWEVRWQKDDLDGNLNFYSVSSDGRVVVWTIIKSELHHSDVIHLRMVEDEGDEAEGGVVAGTQVSSLGCGTTIDFHRSVDYLFLVGTEEGKIHKCSKAYASKYLSTFNAHHMTVYAVRWNHYHPKIFISCSADWTIKIWDHTCSSPIFTFDLGSAVGDVTWAPYSSTVFAAVTSDGKIVVYDLSVNKYEPICQQLIFQKGRTKLTHISFNPVYPVVVVGDDRGYITSVKLSPNLRKAMHPKEVAKGPENEVGKFDKLLALVREPSEQEKK